jgi:hypothetical protein
MKLRIQGNSLRLRVSRSEVARFGEMGRVAETIRFAPEPEAALTYALESSVDANEIGVRWQPGEVAVVIPATAARKWAEGEGVGLYGDCGVGEGRLSVLVEKDFACLDRSDADNADTFPHPLHGTVC